MIGKNAGGVFAIGEGPEVFSGSVALMVINIVLTIRSFTRESNCAALANIYKAVSIGCRAGC